MLIEAHVKPNSNKNEIISKGAIWKVAIKEKAEGGKANLELIKFLEKKLNKRVEIIRGKTSKKKILKII
jgi:uncharacterized protein (TIGR00251 family)